MNLSRDDLNYDGSLRLGFDSPRSPHVTTSTVIHEHSADVTTRNGCSKRRMKARLYEQLIYSIWSTHTASMVFRALVMYILATICKLISFRFVSVWFSIALPVSPTCKLNE